MTQIVKYKVTVTATILETARHGKDWKVVDEGLIEGTNMKKDVYGYTPEIEKTTLKEVPLYEQHVPVLDVSALVSVVNGITRTE